jgi:hypothetical protein
MALERHCLGLITICKFDVGKFVANSFVNLLGYFLRTEHEVDAAEDVAFTGVGYPGNYIAPELKRMLASFFEAPVSRYSRICITRCPNQDRATQSYSQIRLPTFQCSQA